MSIKQPILRAFVPLTRVDDERRIVEGYAAVNEAVPGDKYKLTRQALEAATPDYETWGAVREMHQPSAVGTCNDGGQTEGLGVEWDDKGAFLRCRIVDDSAWEKVKAGVYKGFSVGVRCDKIERGNEVTQCTWVETSLVDRPADPDATIMAFRLDEQEEARGMFAELAAESEKRTLRAEAVRWLYNALSAPPEGGDGETHCAECIAEFKVFWFSRSLHVYDDFESGALVPEIEVEAPEGDRAAVSDDVLQRLERAEADLNREREVANALRVRIAELEAEPKRERPVKFVAVERFPQVDDGAEKLKAELAEILARGAAGTAGEQIARANRVSEIKRILRADYGVEIA